MTEITLLDSMLSLIFLLSISCFVYIFSKKINFPYTVMLVLTGLLLIPVIKIYDINFIRNFSLTPDMLFYIFLPILIFESAYNINYKDLLKSKFSILALSVFWLLISVFWISSIIYFVLPLFWFQVPYIVCLLFWSLISATDTVAVLSLFKSVWAPKRLVTIFEWESLFNDWTSLALFIVILWVISSWKHFDFTTFWTWLETFWSMFFGWIIFWWLTWFVFSKIIWKIKNNESVEITLTMILAHLTFVLSELISEYVVIWGFEVHISWAIATTIAALVMWNYWRYKISPKVSEYMEKFWWFFAFIANSLVFILLWLIVSDISIDLFSWVIFVVITAALAWTISRALSVYIPFAIINFFKIEKKIPFKWQHVLAWGSPRWALAFMMLLMIPTDLTISWWNMTLSVREFLTLITITTIMFTLFVKVPTVWTLLKKLKLNKLNRLDELDQYQSLILINLENINKIWISYQKWNITKKEHDLLVSRYEKSILKYRNLILEISKWNKNNILQRNISLFALWIQRKYLIDLFNYAEIDENNFKFLLNRIESKIRKLEDWDILIVNFDWKYKYNIFEKFTNLFIKIKPEDEYIRNRSQAITLWKVIKELKEISLVDFWFDKKYFDEVINVYQKYYETLPSSKTANTKFVELENVLFEKSIVKSTENTINELKNKWIITAKLYNVFIERIDEKINL